MRYHTAGVLYYVAVILLIVYCNYKNNPGSDILTRG